MSANENEPKQKKFYTSQDVTRIFGISRHKLIYWTDKAGLIEPYQRLPKANLYDFRNLLNIGLVKTFVEFGISSSIIIEWFKKINEEGDIWQWIKKQGERNPSPDIFILSVSQAIPKEGAFRIYLDSYIYDKETNKYDLPSIDSRQISIESQSLKKTPEASHFITKANLHVGLSQLIAQIERLAGETL